MGGRLTRVDRRWVVGGLLGAALVVAVIVGRFRLLDLDVYRVGASALRHGTDVYSVVEPGTGYPFTYPVFGALLFVPFALLPIVVAQSLVTLLSVAALFVITHLTVRWVRPQAALAWSIGLSALAVGLHPVWETLTFGQVNLILVALILLDVLPVERRWRGVLVGLAAGIKLVPGLFIVYFLVTGQRRAALAATLTTLATIAIGFAIQPGPAWDFWTRYALDPSRTGEVAFVTNQSLTGVAARLLQDASPPRWLTLGLSAIVVVVALWLARRLDPVDRLTAACVIGVASLLASPISWSHHWVWAIPCLGTLAFRARWWVFGLVTALLAAGPMQFLPKGQLRELHYTVPQQVVANVYAVLALAYLAFAWVRLRHPAPRP